MSLSLLRSALGLAALLGLVLLLPLGQARWIAASIALIAMASLAIFRAAQRRRDVGELDSDDTREAATLRVPDFHGAAAGIAGACRDAASFDDALRDVAAVPRGEIGAREMHAYRVAAADDEAIRLTEMGGANVGAHGPGRCLGPHDALSATAIRHRRPMPAAPERAVLPLSTENAVTTVIELGGIELEIEPEALVQLLDGAGSALGELAVEDSSTRRVGARLAGQRILLLEPELPASVSLRPKLQRLGASVLRVSSGEAIRRAASETQFDLLLADVDAGWCAADLPFGIARIAVSGQAQPGTEAVFPAREFDAVLCRSCSESQLLAMLTRHLRAPVLQALGDTAAGAAPQVAPSLLDAGALAKLAELDPTGENQLLQRVLRAYETSVARLMPMFEEARRREDMTGMRHVAHTLKSSSASIGAIKFSELCAEIESMIRLHSTETLDERADQLCAELNFVLKAVRQVLDGRP